MTNIINLHDHQSAIWEAYVDAQKRAQASGNLDDAIAAGRAWRRWLDLFLSEDLRILINGEARRNA